MEFTEETFGPIMVFHLSGKIMGDTKTQVLCERLKTLIDADTRSLVMDFSGVRWINSLGIGVIIGCLNTLRQRGGDIRFANLQGTSEKYFHISKLETVVKIFNNVEEAVTSFESNRVLC